MKKLILLIIGFGLIIGTCIMIIIDKNWYNPISSILISVIISSVFYFLGKEDVSIEKEKKINQKWIPQATSSINRLITLRGNLHTLKGANNRKCITIRTHFPNIDKPENSTIKAIIASDCTNMFQRI